MLELASLKQRVDKIEDAASDLVHAAAVAGIVCENVRRQVAPHPVPPFDDSYTKLALTPLIAMAFDQAINDLEGAAERLGEILRIEVAHV